MQYESDIWAAADLLIAAGIKQSKFPDFMMPFFALMLLESRMIRAINNLKEDGYSREEDLEEFIEAFKELEVGYNEYIVRDGKQLSDICKNDKTFKSDWKKYLNGFDNELRMLLGIDRGSDESKYLDLSGVSAELDKKGILLSTVSRWSVLDFTPFDNSEITTLEEHIKRKWADISAETAGEQYTPSDIISLIAEIVGSKVHMPENHGYLSVYDPTCGGGNLLFGVADKLKEIYNTDLILTRGCDFNDTLYALASIESRFREEAKIEHGNTLTKVPFRGTEFDVVIANPPYGVSWKGYKKDIENDQTGQFVALPSVSDGQLLFMQHILYSLNNTGLAVEVHNGSTLFSGDAGGGESNIRKYIFDNDWVEAIIQMPSDEFFNTGIYTYLWVMNKNKPAERKDRVILINGSNGWKLLKKSRGSKRREMLPEHRQAIVDALLNFEDSDIAKVFPKWHFYYNKQGIRLTDVDDAGKSVLDTIIKEGKASHPLKAIEVKVGEIEIPLIGYASKEDARAAVSEIKTYNFKEDNIRFVTNSGTEYFMDANKNTLIRQKADGKTEVLGCGTFNIKTAKNKNATNILVEIVPSYINDYEIIPYSPDEEENQQLIADFMARYVTRPFEYRDNVVGVELNFNKEFYVPKTVERVDDILKDLVELQNELKDEKFSFSDVLTKGLNPDTEFKDSGIEWLGRIPKHWEVKRVKEIASIKKGKLLDTIDEQLPGYKPLLSLDYLRNEKPQFDNYVFTSEKDLYVTENDIIVVWDGAGSGDILKGKEGILSSTIAKISLNEKIVLTKFFYYLRFQLEYKLKSLLTGMGIPHINSNVLREFEIPIPSLSEQQAIADYLDKKTSKIDAIVENINRQLAKLAQLKKSLINECVTGEREV